MEQLTSLLGLKQLINEPTNFESNKTPTYFDLIFTDLPNCIVESGTRPPLCHHQITFAAWIFIYHLRRLLKGKFGILIDLLVLFDLTIRTACSSLYKSWFKTFT